MSSDAVQHTFIAAHQMLAASTRDLETINLEAWLMRTVRNQSIDIVRAHKYLVATADPFDPRQADSAATEIDRRERLHMVTGMIRKLPERQRVALLLREFEDLTHDEIAERLDTSRSAVKSATDPSANNAAQRHRAAAAAAAAAGARRTGQPRRLPRSRVDRGRRPKHRRGDQGRRRGRGDNIGGRRCDARAPAQQSAPRTQSQAPHESLSTQDLAKSDRPA